MFWLLLAGGLVLAYTVLPFLLGLLLGLACDVLPGEEWKVRLMRRMAALLRRAWPDDAWAREKRWEWAMRRRYADPETARLYDRLLKRVGG